MAVHVRNLLRSPQCKGHIAMYSTKAPMLALVDSIIETPTFIFRQRKGILSGGSSHCLVSVKDAPSYQIHTT